MCVECAFCSLRGILLSLFSEACTDAIPWGALKVQSSNSNTKVSRAQVHSLSEGPTRDHGMVFAWLVGQSTFIPQKYQSDCLLNSAQTDWRCYYGSLYLMGEGHSNITWCCCPSSGLVFMFLSYTADEYPNSIMHLIPRHSHHSVLDCLQCAKQTIRHTVSDQTLL